MSTDRRDFLGWIGGTSLLGIGSTVAPELLQAQPVVDRPAPISATWDVSWVDRITGKTRAVFDSPEVSSGAAMFRAVSWADFNKEIYGTERKDVSLVVVLRHNAIPLIMSNAYWTEYEVGKSLKLKDDNGKKWQLTNPISSAGRTGAGANARYLLENFLAEGGIVLACGWAFNQVIANVGKKSGLAREAARTKATELMIPGIIMQPNGIFGALRAQEAGCKYILAS